MSQHEPFPRSSLDDPPASAVSGLRSLSSPESVARFTANLPEALYITAADGGILDGNAALLGLIGVATAEHLRMLRLDDLFPQRDARAYQAELLRRHGHVERFELQLERPDGGVRTVLDTAYLVHDSATGEELVHGMLIDVTPYREAERRLRERAVRDPLTGCFNRWKLDEVMHQVDAGDGEWGVVVVDIDDFKDLNDRRGHEAGDLALVRVARRLAVAARAEDSVFRLGGDEFVILLMDTDAEGTRRVGERLRERNGEPGEVVISMGWAVRREREPLSETIVRADRWMVARRRHERRARTAHPGRRAEDPDGLPWPLV